MNRRTFLSVVSISGITFTGCISNESSEREYKECPYYIIAFNSLPQSAQREIKKAIEESEYTTSEELTVEKLMDVDESHISKTDEETKYYRIIVKENEEYKLRLEQMYPKAEIDPRLKVENSTEKDQKITLRLKVGGEIYFEGDFEVNSEEEITLPDIDYRYGTNNVEVLTKSFSAETTWEVNQFGSGYFLIIGENEISVIGPEDMMDRPKCEF